MFRVTVKQSAMEANAAVEDLVANQGTSLEFASRAEAVALAADLSERHDRVRIQRAAPQDRSGCDGYLIGFPRRFTHEPKREDPSGWTFDVEANLYGALGRALVYGTYGISPAIRYYFDEEVAAYDADRDRLELTAEPGLPVDCERGVSWCPDCCIRVRQRTTGDVTTSFFVEIKTGDASFQRGQLEDMMRVARTHRVLKIRLWIDGLPANYRMRIDEVRPG